jgi:molybdopterin molybdotransferase
MDGYALRFAELPGPWTVTGESAAGGSVAPPLGPHEAARIFTGAPVPPGADTILVQEAAARAGDRLTLAAEGPPRQRAHTRRAGGDFAAGETLLPPATAIGAAQIALAALGGHGALPVRRRPRIALLSTGDELVPPGAPTPGVALPASNAPMLAALLRATLPVDTEDRGIVRDDLDAIAAAFVRAADADIIVTTGGASVGDHDLVRPALEKAGARLDFWRIAMKPGKPLLAGTLGGAVVLGLPGNPVSAYVTARLFLLPLVRHLLGAPDPFPATRAAPLGAPLPPTRGRTEYLRGRYGAGGIVEAGSQDSAAMRALAAADLLIVRPANSPAAKAGDSVEILPFA